MPVFSPPVSKNSRSDQISVPACELGLLRCSIESISPVLAAMAMDWPSLVDVARPCSRRKSVLCYMCVVEVIFLRNNLSWEPQKLLRMCFYRVSISLVQNGPASLDLTRPLLRIHRRKGVALSNPLAEELVSQTSLKLNWIVSDRYIYSGLLCPYWNKV